MFLKWKGHSVKCNAQNCSFNTLISLDISLPNGSNPLTASSCKLMCHTGKKSAGNLLTSFVIAKKWRCSAGVWMTVIGSFSHARGCDEKNALHWWSPHILGLQEMGMGSWQSSQVKWTNSSQPEVHEMDGKGIQHVAISDTNIIKPY